jgi:hypothetical protein
MLKTSLINKDDVFNYSQKLNMKSSDSNLKNLKNLKNMKSNNITVKNIKKPEHYDSPSYMMRDTNDEYLVGTRKDVVINDVTISVPITITNTDIKEILNSSEIKKNIETFLPVMNTLKNLFPNIKGELSLEEINNTVELLKTQSNEKNSTTITDLIILLNLMNEKLIENVLSFENNNEKNNASGGLKKNTKKMKKGKKGKKTQKKKNTKKDKKNTKKHKKGKNMKKRKGKKYTKKMKGGNPLTQDTIREIAAHCNGNELFAGDDDEGQTQLWSEYKRRNPTIVGNDATQCPVSYLYFDNRKTDPNGLLNIQPLPLDENNLPQISEDAYWNSMKLKQYNGNCLQNGYLTLTNPTNQQKVCFNKQIGNIDKITDNWTLKQFLSLFKNSSNGNWPTNWPTRQEIDNIDLGNFPSYEDVYMVADTANLQIPDFLLSPAQGPPKPLEEKVKVFISCFEGIDSAANWPNTPDIHQDLRGRQITSEQRDICNTDVQNAIRLSTIPLSSAAPAAAPAAAQAPAQVIFSANDGTLLLPKIQFIFLTLSVISIASLFGLSWNMIFTLLLLLYTTVSFTSYGERIVNEIQRRGSNTINFNGFDIIGLLSSLGRNISNGYNFTIRHTRRFIQSRQTQRNPEAERIINSIDAFIKDRLEINPALTIQQVDRATQNATTRCYMCPRCGMYSEVTNCASLIYHFLPKPPRTFTPQMTLNFANVEREIGHNFEPITNRQLIADTFRININRLSSNVQQESFYNDTRCQNCLFFSPSNLSWIPINAYAIFEGMPTTNNQLLFGQYGSKPCASYIQRHADVQDWASLYMNQYGIVFNKIPNRDGRTYTNLANFDNIADWREPNSDVKNDIQIAYYDQNQRAHINQNIVNSLQYLRTPGTSIGGKLAGAFMFGELYGIPSDSDYDEIRTDFRRIFRMDDNNQFGITQRDMATGQTRFKNDILELAGKIREKYLQSQYYRDFTERKRQQLNTQKDALIRKIIRQFPNIRVSVLDDASIQTLAFASSAAAQASSATAQASSAAAQASSSTEPQSNEDMDLQSVLLLIQEMEQNNDSLSDSDEESQLAAALLMSQEMQQPNYASPSAQSSASSSFLPQSFTSNNPPRTALSTPLLRQSGTSVTREISSNDTWSDVFVPFIQTVFNINARTPALFNTPLGRTYIERYRADFRERLITRGNIRYDRPGHIQAAYQNYLIYPRSSPPGGSNIPSDYFWRGIYPYFENLHNGLRTGAIRTGTEVGDDE